MEFEKCYVFRSEDARSAKRRRTEPRGLQASWKLRQKAYQRAWQSLQANIDAKLDEIDATIVSSVTSYLEDIINKPRSPRIPVGLILTGPGATFHSSLARQASASDGSAPSRRIFVPISSSSGSNLKSLLKAINQKATSQSYGNDDDDDDEVAIPSRKGTKLLNYDLQILHDYVQERRIRQVVIAFEDTEAFDSNLLSEVLELLHSWLDRIPTVCLLSIATSVDFLQQRLSNAALKTLDGRLFDAVLSREEVEQVFDAITAAPNPLCIGPNLMSTMLERQSDFLLGIDSLVHAAQYAYMSCYYANALTLFLAPDLRLPDVPADHFDALRNTPSFRALVQRLLDAGDAPAASALLTSDDALFTQVRASIAEAHASLARTTSATTLIRSLQRGLPNTPLSSPSSLYTQALSGRLSPPSSSPLLRTLLLSLRKLPSDQALPLISSLLSSLPESSPLLPSLSKSHTSLLSLLSSLSSSSSSSSSSTIPPLRSTESLPHPSLLPHRTTSVAAKASLSTARAALSSRDEEYTSLLRAVSDALEASLAADLVPVARLAFHEVFCCDSRSPYREAFTPRPRQAVERALAAPWDYLDCACCGPEGGEEEGEGEVALAGTMPATAVGYRLCLEGGALINVRDLWEAFGAVVGEGEEERDEGRDMALFQRGLAELRFLGFVKGTRSRVDHVVKVAWRGL